MICGRPPLSSQEQIDVEFSMNTDDFFIDSPRKSPRKNSLGAFLGGQSKQQPQHSKDNNASVSTANTVDLTETELNLDEPETFDFNDSKPLLSLMDSVGSLESLEWFSLRDAIATRESLSSKIIEEDPVEEEESEASRQRTIDLKNHKNLRMQRVLGEGQFGQVWLVSTEGKKAENGVPYALKVQSKYEIVEEDKVLCLLREKEIMMSLDHPNIIKLEESYQDIHFVHFLMEFPQGGELWSLMHPSTDEEILSICLPEAQAKFYSLSVADALAYIHEKGIAYRDLKPENILIDSTGYPKLIDFGLAIYLAEDEKAFTMVGTPSYCAPELLSSNGHDARADDWALGILVYEMLTGSNPFFCEGMDQWTLYESISDDDYKAACNVSSNACSLIAGLLEKDPSKRLGSEDKSDIIKHSWFNELDLAAIRRREVAAPWIPNVSDALDSSHFEDWSDLEDKTQRNYPHLSVKEGALFDAF